MTASQNHSGSADAALRATAFQKCLLQRAQLRTLGKTFDGREICARCLQNRNKTAIHQLAVQQDGARTAFAFSATFLGTRQPKFPSEAIQESLHVINSNRFRLAVYCESKLAFAAILGGVGHLFPSVVLSAMPSAQTASNISSGSSGTASKRVPSASSIALTMAGAGPSIGSSPIPLAPYAPWRFPISSKNTRICGKSAEVGMM